MLLELCFGDKWHKSLATKEWVREEGLSVWEAECHLDAKLFQDEYPRWDVGGSHCPIILKRMFMQATEVGQKEEQRFIH